VYALNAESLTVGWLRRNCGRWIKDREGPEGSAGPDALVDAVFVWVVDGVLRSDVCIDLSVLFDDLPLAPARSCGWRLREPVVAARWLLVVARWLPVVVARRSPAVVVRGLPVVAVVGRLPVVVAGRLPLVVGRLPEASWDAPERLASERSLVRLLAAPSDLPAGLPAASGDIPDLPDGDPDAPSPGEGTNALDVPPEATEESMF